jgi:hypothetical protein
MEWEKLAETSVVAPQGRQRKRGRKRGMETER